MYCPKCGHKNTDEANFCGGCGKAMYGSTNAKPILAVVLTLLIGGAGYGYATDWSFQWPSETTASVKTKVVHKDEAELKIKKAPTVVNETKQQVKDKTELIKESLPSVFTIGTRDGLGSGFFYKAGGYIVTNAHVVAGYTDVTVKNSVGENFEGTVIGISDRYDIALIKSEANKHVKPFVTETKETPIGTEVIALGSPKGLENTASIGYLTGLNRDMEIDFIYEKIYQIDAQIDHGSSGGPLLDATTGKVIGINSLLYKDNTVFGFSIPMHSMQKQVDEWIHAPMSSKAVAALFNVYDDYVPESYQDSEDTSWDYEDYGGFDDSEEDYTEEPELEDTEVANEEVEDFIHGFRSQYELAIDYNDYEYIAPYVAAGSSAESELWDFLNDLSMKNEFYEFIDTSVTDVMYTNQSIEVYTYETLNFTKEDGTVQFLEKKKLYTLIYDEYGDYQIKQISNQ
ncbi:MULTISPECIES: trypsin-like peptidase domain-containing protein [unclassified Sporosarcina]|uniref:trypsin-like peptidase domain-containing protein n=1 Tax=unclassified Sporosarcina TaxID=2647733 RepID=UPI000C171886|nr:MULTISPECIES: trypsin-like peptidase domain-containing protein [unclassified Sporosarcina]PID04382.1 hypothetical protein CSV66_15350 [Sporosarcina sp. P30]PID07560.1 hypothetical protein CSV65_15420 [Sporosarcina sp. P31]PID10767.1 hypothetical protein CSV64_15355 [Sporosarcina sp. P32b]